MEAALSYTIGLGALGTLSLQDQRRIQPTGTLSRRRPTRSTDTRVLEDACSWKCFLQLRRSDVFHALGVSRALQLGQRFSIPCGLKRTHGLDRIPPFLDAAASCHHHSLLLSFVFELLPLSIFEEIEGRNGTLGEKAVYGTHLIRENIESSLKPG